MSEALTLRPADPLPNALNGEMPVKYTNLKDLIKNDSLTLRKHEGPGLGDRGLRAASTKWNYLEREFRRNLNAAGTTAT